MKLTVSTLLDKYELVKTIDLINITYHTSSRIVNIFNTKMNILLIMSVKYWSPHSLSGGPRKKTTSLQKGNHVHQENTVKLQNPPPIYFDI